MVGPVHPVPPHWPYRGAPPLDEEELEDVLLVELLEVDLDVDEVEELVDEVLVLEVELDGEDELLEPLQVKGRGPGMVYDVGTG